MNNHCPVMHSLDRHLYEMEKEEAIDRTIDEAVENGWRNLTEEHLIDVIGHIENNDSAWKYLLIAIKGGRKDFLADFMDEMTVHVHNYLENGAKRFLTKHIPHVHEKQYWRTLFDACD